MCDDIVARYENVSKDYDGVKVVKDLTFDIKRGEFLSLLGPSGSGKTTTLMMLAGLQSPSSGNIYLDRKPIVGIPPHRRNIGVVFQNYALFPHMTVGENVSFPLRARRMHGAEITARVRTSLAMVQLDALVDRRPAELSGGQQQRVALARALVFDPSLVLLDEPLGALDRQLRENMQLELKQLHRQTGITMVYVTHDQGEAMTMSDRVAVFDQGKILQCSAPEEIYNAPNSRFVAEFVGENNRFAGVVEAVDAAECAVRTSNSMLIRAHPSKDLAVGESVQVYVRPERIDVGTTAKSHSNSYLAHIRDAIFLGDHTRLKVEIPGHPEVTVKRNFFGEADNLPAPGQTTVVGWSLEASRVVTR
ncbi:ABC transporter ATP-binding protein [Defluviimonas sp. SAOS-178_SWC]|uniref:ABC transporter ATP-binding protein n=1 Tax=Defluviimonas sp. SAOS-178_SWC TaxID=3121287 RepID=UPI0032218708